MGIPLDEAKSTATNPVYQQCSMFAVDFAKMLDKYNGSVSALIDAEQPNKNWPKQACTNGWDYDRSEIPYETVATKFNWVCEQSALPTLAQSIFFVGAIVGGLLFGWIADRYGRIPALVLCNVTGFAGGIATAFVTNFWQFSFCRFLVGFAFDNCFTMMYILGKFK